MLAPRNFPTVYRDTDNVLWKIAGRVGYVIPGSLAGTRLPAGAPTSFIQFPDATFTHNVTAPFEIWDMLPRAQLVDANENPLADPLPDINCWWRARIAYNQKNNQPVLRSDQRMSAVVDSLTRIWSLDQPYYFANQQGWTISVASLVPAGGSAMSVDISLRGYLIEKGERLGVAAPMPYDRSPYQDVPVAPPPEQQPSPWGAYRGQ